MKRIKFIEFLKEAEDLKITGKSMNKICKELEGTYKTKAATLKRRWIRHGKGKKMAEKKPKLKNKYQGKKGKPTLSIEEEAALVTVLKMMALSNHALSKNEIKEYVHETYRRSQPNWRSDKWLVKFLKRNKGTLFDDRPLKIIAAARIDQNSISSVEQFIEAVKLKSETFKFHESNVVNVDEFQLKVSGYSAGRCKITAVRRSGVVHKQIASELRGGCVGSLIAFISAEGSLLYSALCLKPDGKCRNKDDDTDIYYIQSDKMDEQGANTRFRPIPQVRIYTETGMIDNECWKQIFAGFVDYLNNITPGKSYLTYMDNLPQHIQPDVVLDAVNRGVESMYLVKGTSQWSQPDDQVPFGTMRKEMNKSCCARMPRAKGETLNHLIRDVVPEAMAKAFTPSIIKAAFRDTGLYPFNEQIIRERCMENLGCTSETSAMAEVEEKALQAITDIHKKDGPGGEKKKKRLRAPVGLNQAYTSGHVIQGHEEELRKKAEEERMKRLRKETAEEKRKERERIKEEKKVALDEKRNEARLKKEERLLEAKARVCSVCKRRKTARTKDGADWFRCQNCPSYSLCPKHEEEMKMHNETCKN